VGKTIYNNVLFCVKAVSYKCGTATMRNEDKIQSKQK
jgi:hypothetical protein